MELKKGMYIRTKKGIGKIHEIRDFMGELEFHLDSNTGKIHQPVGNMYWNNVEDIIGEPSFNIVDLIEVGDYVNGYLVIEKPYKYYDKQFISLDTTESWSWGKGEMPAKYIETIITKEQFNACKYVVERDTNEGRLTKNNQTLWCKCSTKTIS